MRHYEEEISYLEFGGSYIYIDLNEIVNVVKMDGVKPPSNNDDDEDESDNPALITIDVTKWELINKMIDTILDVLNEEDPALGAKNLEKLPVSFKIAYNTLVKYNIIKIVEE